MRFVYAIFILGLLQTAMFTTVSCDESNGIMRHQAVKKDDVPRVKIKVFRGPTQEGNGDFFATWGYWIQQPNR